MRIYRDIIKQAWTALWHTPSVWVFGVFAALAGNGGEYTSVANTVNLIEARAELLSTLQSALTSNWLQKLIDQAVANVTARPLLVTWIVLVALASVMLVMYIIVVSQIALIRTAANLADGRKVSFFDSLSVGVKRFWPVFILNVLLNFSLWLLLTAAIMPFFIYYLAGANAWSFGSVIVISFLASVPLTVILSFVTKYAAMFVVLEGERWWNALEKAFGLFFRNWLVSLEMALLLLAINFGIGIILAFIFMPDAIALPTSIANSQLNPILAIRLSLVFLISWGVGAIFSGFQYFAWTFLFKRLQSGSVVAKLVRLTDGLPNVPWFDTARPAPTSAKQRK